MAEVVEDFLALVHKAQPQEQAVQAEAAEAVEAVLEKTLLLQLLVVQVVLDASFFTTNS
jgi:hypothetical protein